MPGNAHKRKGDQFERDVVDALKAMDLEAYRTLSAGIPHDAGDIHVGRDFVISAKDRAYWSNIADWVDDVRPMKVASRRLHGVLVMKRIRKPIAQSYVILTLEDFGSLVHQVEP